MLRRTVFALLTSLALASHAGAQIPSAVPGWVPAATAMAVPFEEGAVTFFGTVYDTDDEAAVNDAADLNAGTGSLTVSLWILTTDDGSAPLTKIDLALATSGWRVFVNGDGSISFSVKQGGVLKNSGGVAVINDGLPHFIMGVIDQANDEIRTYVDGVIDGTPTAITDASITNTDSLYFARFHGTDERFFTGIITQTRLAAGVVRTVAQGVVDMNSVKLVGWETNYWQMQPGTGTTITNEINATNSAAFGAGAAAPDWTDRLTRADLQ